MIEVMRFAGSTIQPPVFTNIEHCVNVRHMSTLQPAITHTHTLQNEPLVLSPIQRRYRANFLAM